MGENDDLGPSVESESTMLAGESSGDTRDSPNLDVDTMIEAETIAQAAAVQAQQHVW